MGITDFFNSLKTRLGDVQLGNEPEGLQRDESEAVGKIVQQLDNLEPERARFIAAFAYLLSRVAHADMNISDAETLEMEHQIIRLSRLPAEQAVLVVQIAKNQATLVGGTENFLVTQEFNRIANLEQKLALLDCLFAVAAADKVISGVEDREIGLINTELLLTHQQFISARSNFLQYLAVLKNPE